tara:strand:- start:2 stop:1030 length:1029 start_codon:yes stop_codon:yes gene_type:complete
MAVYTSIDNPELYFQTKLYTGTGSAASITLDGDEDMQPDLVWFKKRSSTESHYVYDAVRGVTKEIYANSTAAEDTDANSLTGFNSDGFSIGNANQLSESSETMVAWCWKESATAGFDITTWTGNATNRTISHNLSPLVPRMLIIKNTSTTDNWFVYHEGMGNNTYMHLETVNAGLSPSTNQFQATTPTSSVFSIGTADGVNKNTSTIICYTFAPVQGFSKFGSYTGNSNADGAFIWCGFKPSFVMTKAYANTSGSNNWFIADNKRHSVAPASGGTNFNVIDRQLYANLNNADDTNSSIDFLSNGFKWRRDGGDTNFSGRTFVYMAFAEAPFVNSKGVPCNAR